MAVYVERNRQGFLVVSGSRVSVSSVVRAFWAGETPETICEAYPSLSLEQSYGVIAHHLAHRSEIDAELVAQDKEVARLRGDARTRNSELRSRLTSGQPTRP